MITTKKPINKCSCGAFSVEGARYCHICGKPLLTNTSYINTTPNWASDVTSEQKRILTELINDMVFVEGGTFTMGATSEQGGDAYSEETPVHDVTLSDFYIGKYEVTQEQWKAVMGNDPSGFKGSQNPVECVSWNDCKEFITKLNKLTGLDFWFPTEAQWEYAARGGKKSRGYKYSGSNNCGSVAWYDGNSWGETHPVGQKQPNELGLYDMSGNVYEWCSDYYDSYSSTAETDPQGPTSGDDRVHRGGSSTDGARYCRVSDRFGSTSGYGYNEVGLRLVLIGGLYTDNINTPPDSVVVTDYINTTPNWASDVTSKQKRILTELINDMVFVEGGTFQMGATSEQGEDAENDEKPVHDVTLSDYYIGKYEVTQEQWEAVMGKNPSRFKGSQNPVECVSWDDCKEFINKLKQLTGLDFWFPTEAQWEYAARGGKKSRGYKYSGSYNVGLVAWYDGNASYRTHPVGQKLPNELGLYDMSGNVWEWCSDYGDSYNNSQTVDPEGPTSGNVRMGRGGSWDDGARFCRESNRGCYAPDHCYFYLGLRLALTGGR